MNSSLKMFVIVVERHINKQVFRRERVKPLQITVLQTKKRNGKEEMPVVYEPITRERIWKPLNVFSEKLGQFEILFKFFDSILNYIFGGP